MFLEQFPLQYFNLQLFSVLKMNGMFLNTAKFLQLSSKIRLSAGSIIAIMDGVHMVRRMCSAIKLKGVEHHDRTG